MARRAGNPQPGRTPLKKNGRPSSKTVPGGNTPAVAAAPPKTSVALLGICTPFAKTVIPAPSRAPIKLGSCSSSARLPFSEVFHPITDSNGSRSTCGLLICCCPPEGVTNVGTKYASLTSVPLKLPVPGVFTPVDEVVPATHLYCPDGS